jgi:hypothetical protein
VRNQAKADKPRPDHKRYVAIQVFANLIGVVVVVAFLAWIVFGLFGPGGGTMTEVRAFMLLFLLCFVLIQCHGAVINTRRDFIRGKWLMGDPGGIEPDGVFNPWRRIAPLALPAGIVLALAAWFLLPLTEQASFRLFAIEAIAFVLLLLVTTALIAVILPGDQVSFTGALSGRVPREVPGFPAYFLVEHFLPWAVIQGLINLGIGVKQFKWVLEGTEPAAAITGELLASDFGIVFGILYFFMFLASDGQVRGDVRLGRLEPKHFGTPRLGRVGVPLIAVGAILTTLLIMAAVALFMRGVFSLAGLDVFSVGAAVAFKTVSAVLGTLAGCAVGVWWGRRRESALEGAVNQRADDSRR